MNLPERFVSRMEGYFSKRPEISAKGFFDSFRLTPERGIRINRIKSEEKRDCEILRALGENPNPVPWCTSGYYVGDQITGNDPYSHAGVFYQQEPSAMLPAEMLAPVPGDFILDLCAAPGGKATRIAELLNKKGLLIANDISADRCRPLLRNLERTGADDVVILSESPNHLSEHFPEHFDKILVDAPCSGEGMFRRDPNAIKSWERFGVETTVLMQRDILRYANTMLRPGGVLVYSTCTFSEEENEKMAEWFLSEYPFYRTTSNAVVRGVSFTSVTGKTGEAIRIWPHISRGEGHFCIRLTKGAEEENTRKQSRDCESNSKGLSEVPDAVTNFMNGLLTRSAAEQYLERIRKHGFIINNRLHIHKRPIQEYDSLKAVKLGAYCGDIKYVSGNSIFIPSDSYSATLSEKDVRPERRLCLCRDDERTRKYLKGETLFASSEEQDYLEERNHILVLIDGFPVGFAKYENRTIKNLYPKSRRIL